MNDTIQLSTGGKIFDGWKNLSIDESMEYLSSKFKIDFYDKQGVASSLIKAGNSCRLDLIGDNVAPYTLLDGYIDSTNRKLAGTSTSMSFSGRDKTGDLVDCSAVRRSNSWANAKLDTIVRDLVKPFGILVDSSSLQGAPTVERFVLQNGESVFEAIERLCLHFAILPLHTNEGNIELTYTAPESTRSVENLEVGINLLDVEEDENFTGRFAEYVVKGQNVGQGKAWTGENTQMFASAEDVDVDRYRPLLFMNENRATPKGLIKRVSWEAQVRAGRSLHYTATVKGWFQRDSNGNRVRPWTINERTNLRIASWGVNRELLITGVKRGLSESTARVTTMTLKHPDTYAANPTRSVKLV